MNQNLKEQYKIVCGIIDKIYPQAAELARKYDLSIATIRNKKDVSDSVDCLIIEGLDPNYRIGMKVSLDKCGEPGEAYVWSLVTNLRDDKWDQHIRDTPVGELEQEILICLSAMDGWLAENDGIDPKEAKKRLMGTQYFWDHEQNHGWHEWTTDFDGSDFSGTVEGDDGGYEGTFNDADGDSVHTIRGNSPNDVMQKMEKHFIEMNKQLKDLGW